MKYCLSFLVVLFTAVETTSATAMEPTFAPASKATESPDYSDAPFSHYGHGHEDLHKHGSIEALMERAGSNCCDGGKGGECRKTDLRPNGVGWEILIDGKWCPVKTTIHYDVPLPRDTLAMGCASKPSKNDLDPVTGMRIKCPTVHCAAGSMGS